MTWPFGDLQPLRYGCVLVDPPWSFRLYSAKGQKKSPQAHYTCMDLPAIKALPVAQLAAPDCACLMWATAPMLPQAIETLAAWGFSFKSAGTWAKRSSTGGKWAFGPGYCFRSAAEFFLLGTIGRPRQKVRNVRNLIVAPMREHSRKPDEMRYRLQEMFDGPYVELFARERHAGWDAWGDQVDRFTEAASLASMTFRRASSSGPGAAVPGGDMLAEL